LAKKVKISIAHNSEPQKYGMESVLRLTPPHTKLAKSKTFCGRRGRWTDTSEFGKSTRCLAM